MSPHTAAIREVTALGATKRRSYSPDMTAEPAEELPRLLADMGRLAGVSRTTLVNWTTADPPLEISRSGRLRRVSWRQLTTFCRSHPELPAARRVLDAARAQDRDAAASDSHELDEVRSLARAARAAAAANHEALVVASRLAEETARAHREQLEHLRDSLAALDDALGQFTVPSTLND
jgi:hypothetical protein